MLGASPFVFQRIIVRGVQPWLLIGFTMVIGYATSQPLYLALFCVLLTVIAALMYRRHVHDKHSRANALTVQPDLPRDEQAVSFDNGDSDPDGDGEGVDDEEEEDAGEEMSGGDACRSEFDGVGGFAKSDGPNNCSFGLSFGSRSGCSGRDAERAAVEAGDLSSHAEHPTRAAGEFGQSNDSVGPYSVPSVSLSLNLSDFESQ